MGFIITIIFFIFIIIIITIIFIIFIIIIIIIIIIILIIDLIFLQFQIIVILRNEHIFHFIWRMSSITIQPNLFSRTYSFFSPFTSRRIANPNSNRCILKKKNNIFKKKIIKSTLVDTTA